MKLHAEHQWIDPKAVDDPSEPTLTRIAGQVISFRVVNGSPEIVGPVAVELMDMFAMVKIPKALISVDVIPPGGETTVSFLLASDEAVPLESLEAVLSFRDTGGHWWRRIAAKPIQTMHGTPPMFSEIIHPPSNWSVHQRLAALRKLWG